MVRSFISALVITLIVNCMLAAQTAQKLPMGMNMGDINYYNTNLMFFDVAKTFSDWLINWSEDEAKDIPKDTNGYPLEIPYNGKMPVALYNDYYPAGRYVVLYDGEGEPDFGGDAVQKAPGRIVINISGQGGHRWLTLRKSVKGNHVRNIRIIPERAESYYQDSVFFPLYLKGAEKFHCLRFMDLIHTNSSLMKAWGDRRLPTSCTQSTHQRHGTAIEYMVDLCNTVNANGWFCIPHQADDDLIRRYAELVRDRLKPTLKAYVEYSNELWNWAGAFQQSHWVVNNAPGMPDSIQNALKAIEAAGGSFPEKAGYMMERTFKIWQSVFAGAHAHRLVRVCGVQKDWVSNTERYLASLKNRGGCDAVSPTGYFGLSSASRGALAAKGSAATAADVLKLAGDDLSKEMEMTRQNAATINKYRGQPGFEKLQYICYEGGQHIDPQGQDLSYSKALWDAQVHPEMHELYMRNFAVHTEATVNCSLFCAFAYISPRESKWGSWGHLEYLSQLENRETLMQTAPKYKALLDVNTEKQVVHARYRTAIGKSVSTFPRIRLVSTMGRTGSNRRNGIFYDIRGRQTGDFRAKNPKPGNGIYIEKSAPGHLSGL